MNLTDVLPCTAEELYKLQHDHKENKDCTDARRDRLRPFADAFIMCTRSCGFLTDNPRQEYAIHMSALALIDFIIEDYTKRDAV
jgi:hypothetical protein